MEENTCRGVNEVIREFLYMYNGITGESETVDMSGGQSVVVVEGRVICAWSGLSRPDSPGDGGEGPSSSM
jgi:hypothetical protein